MITVSTECILTGEELKRLLEDLGMVVASGGSV